MHKLLTAVLLMFVAGSLFADEAADLLKRIDKVRNPYESFEFDLQLTSHRDATVETYRYKVSGRVDGKSLVEFVAPASEKGKYLLMVDDNMWIYMPNTSRPIRISPLQRLAGDASNADVARGRFAADYNAVIGGSETIDGHEAQIVDLTARNADVSYTKVKLWVDKKTSHPLRADFYVASGKLFKRAFYRKYAVVDGHEMLTDVDIEDVVRPGRHTEMTYSRLHAATLADRLFNKDQIGKW
jgi:outer membrane lipoprotein-sorting protein